MRVYSPFFQTLHDEPAPIGTTRGIGRGAHYSVLRCFAHWDHSEHEQIPASYQDLVVLWDEDHDVRVINAIEDLYRHRLLHPILFIGETKGNLSAIIVQYYPKEKLARFEERFSRVAQSQLDPWLPEVTVWRAQEPTILGERSDRVQTYLDVIDMLWKPGLKPVPRPSEG